MSDHNLLGRVIERVDPADVAREMVAAFRNEIPGYRRLPEAVVMGQIFEVSRQNVELFFRSVLEAREPSAEELDAFRASARNRAAEGMQLEDLLHAYRLGGRLGWRAISSAAEGPDEERALLLGAELLMRYVDSVSAAVAQTYLDERQHLVSEEERRLRELLEGLIRDRPLAPGVEEYARRVGLPLAGRYRAFAQTLPGAPTHAHSQVAAALRARGMLALTEGDRVSGLAPADAQASEFANGRALLALGTPAERGQLAPALEEARLLVEIGGRKGRTGVISAEDCPLELLLARAPRLGEVVRRRVLEPLEAYAERRSSELLETLVAFFECELDRRRAASHLHVHPNTLDYRLQRIGELARLDLRRPEDVALVTLALKQRELTSADEL